MVVPFHKNTAGPALWGRPPYLMKEKIKEIVVPREDAVFWLDGNGFWHNREEKFTHRKIINYFHSSIRKDKKGYYLFQVHPGYREKVYFPYEDTALFVFEVVRDEEPVLVLNTGKRIKLEPSKMFIKGDSLYMEAGGERIKFTEQALVRIADLIEEKDGRCFIRVGGQEHRIKETKSPQP